jgi:hypothetical protein
MLAVAPSSYNNQFFEAVLYDDVISSQCSMRALAHIVSTPSLVLIPIDTFDSDVYRLYGL